MLRRNVFMLAATNGMAAFGLAAFAPGTSPSLAMLDFFAPLPLWASAFAAAAVLQLCGQPLIGHSIAFPLWALLAFGAVWGLTSGSSAAPAASVILAGLELCAAGLHLNGMEWRRREREAKRAK
jgi:hypothetical protein